MTLFPYPEGVTVSREDCICLTVEGTYQLPRSTSSPHSWVWSLCTGHAIFQDFTKHYLTLSKPIHLQCGMRCPSCLKFTYSEKFAQTPWFMLEAFAIKLDRAGFGWLTQQMKVILSFLSMYVCDITWPLRSQLNWLCELKSAFFSNSKGCENPLLVMIEFGVFSETAMRCRKQTFFLCRYFWLTTGRQLFWHLMTLIVTFWVDFCSVKTTTFSLKFDSH